MFGFRKQKRPIPSDLEKQALVSNAVLLECAQILMQPNDRTNQTSAVLSICDCVLKHDERLALVWTWFGDANSASISPQIMAGPAKTYAQSLTIERSLLTELGPVFQSLKGNRSTPYKISKLTPYKRWRAALEAYGIRSVLAVPLATTGSSQAGLMVFYATQSDYFEKMGSHLFESIGHVTGALLLKQHELNRYQTLAYYDQMTGLLNRSGFARALQAHPESGTCVIMDVDKFKSINDVYGHSAGDAIVQQLGVLLKTFAKTWCTTAKTALPQGLTARWGGDEFVLFLFETEFSKTLVPLQRLRSLIELHPFSLLDATVLKITVSMGVAPCHQPLIDFSGAIALADSAMYEAKAIGGNCLKSKL
jgi:diguanylate cyclase (GGDEF)-like protein